MSTELLSFEACLVFSTLYSEAALIPVRKALISAYYTIPPPTFRGIMVLFRTITSATLTNERAQRPLLSLLVITDNCLSEAHVATSNRKKVKVGARIGAEPLEVSPAIGRA
jgi:hypothetical protein